jgi:uncharacterized repeat protein (TIGR03803 family)
MRPAQLVTATQATRPIYRVLYSFKGRSDGSGPSGGLIRDRAGNLYGTTQTGGTYNKGVVFKLDPTGKETVLYSFTGGTDGSEPPPCGPSGCSLDPVAAGLIRDSAGNLYGTTPFGGTYALGVAFKLDPYGHETVLHTFTGGEEGQIPSQV